MKKFLCCLSLLFILNGGYGQAGLPDSTFGINGTVTTNISDFSDLVMAVAIQEDGKIVAAGISGRFTDLAAVRYNVDGSLDSTFSDDGISDIPPLPAGGHVADIAIQEDGKIIVAGYALYDTGRKAALVRFNNDGTLDTTFGSDGLVTTYVEGEQSWFNSVVVQSDGKLLAGGFHASASAGGLLLTRCNIDGSLDPVFGTEGIVAQYWGNIISVDLQHNGKIIAGGTINGQLLITRFDSLGKLDSTFAVNGIFKWAESSTCWSLNVQGDEKIVAAGCYNSSMNFTVLRLLPDGLYDTFFGDQGKVITSPSNEANIIVGSVIQKDGKIVVGGYSSNNSPAIWTIARYTSAGVLDSTFGKDGLIFHGLGSVQSLAIQTDGKIVAAGSSTAGWVVRRYLNFIDPTAIEEQDHAPGSLFFPNPTTGLFYLQSPVSSTGIEVFDKAGRLVMQGPYKNEIDLSSFPKGMYFIRICNSDTSTVHKIILQ